MDAGVEAAFCASGLFQDLLPPCRVERFEDHQSLSAFADAERSVGLVVHGRADVWCVASDGTETLMNTIGPGDCFGIAYVYGRTEMQTRVLAIGRCDVAFVSRSTIRTLMLRNMEFAERYHAFCNQKLQFLLGRIALLTAQSCRTRLAAFLLLNRDEKGFVALPGTKDQLARRLSVSRAAVYRELNELQKKGAILPAKQGIAVRDADLLERQLYEERESKSEKE